jgi:hypothetical protein
MHLGQKFLLRKQRFAIKLFCLQISLRVQSANIAQPAKAVSRYISKSTTRTTSTSNVDSAIRSSTVLCVCKATFRRSIEIVVPISVVKASASASGFWLRLLASGCNRSQKPVRFLKPEAEARSQLGKNLKPEAEAS